MDNAATTTENEAYSNVETVQPFTPDLVRQVADRVFQLLQNDLRLERERLGLRYRRNTVSRRY